MKKGKKVLTACIATAMLTVGTAANVLANPNGFYINGQEFLFSDLNKPAAISAANSALTGLTFNDVILDMSSQRANFGKYVTSVGNAGVNNTSFATYASAHPEAVPAGSTVYNAADPSNPITNVDLTTGLSVTSVSAINVTTVATTKPVLPPTVTATMSDLSTKEVAVTWDPFDASSYAATGSFYVYGTIAESTTVKAKAIVTVEEAQLSISNASVLLADSTDGNLKADGKTVMTVTATYKDAVAQGFTGTAELVSKNGLVAAQTDAAFDKGVATFNVTLPNSTTDIQDQLSVRIVRSNIDGTKNVESAPVSLTYKAYVPNGGGTDNTVRTYSVDAVKSADMADRVNVYVADVANSDIPAVEAAIKAQLTLSNGTVTDMAIAAIDDNPIVVGTPTSSTSASYVFSALVDLKGGADYLYDNQDNFYTIAAPASDANINLATKTGSFALIDKTQPVMSAVNLPVLTPQTNTIAVTFSEPINTEPAANDNSTNSTNSALLPANWVLNGHVLQKPDLIATGITVMPGNARNTVYINLTNSAAQKYLTDGENLIQAKSISDWAGLTDLTDNNKISTQDFTFNYTKPVVAPGLAISMESPEQFELSLGSALYSDKDATVNTDLTAPSALKVELINTTTQATILDLTGDYTIIKDGDKYLLELNKDWTKLLTDPTTYHNQTLKISMGTAYDVYGNQVSGALDAAATDLQPLSGTVVIPEDTTSPFTTSKTILDMVDPSLQNAASDVSTTGHVAVTMSEPVQLLKADNNVTTSLMDDVLTPSVQQDQIGGVPVPTFEYVKVSSGGKVNVGDSIDGHIEADSVSIHDTQFTVAPNAALEAGEWQLVIRSISDDVGNTMKTETVNVVIPANGPVVQLGDNQVDPYVMWAYAENDKTVDGTTNDYVKILYSRQMSVDALRSATYDINGKQVNQDASITAESVVLYRQNSDPTNVNYNKFYGENNNMMNWTGELVTIKLPSTFITGDDLNGANSHNMLTLPTTLSARDDGVATTKENLLFANNNGSNQYQLKFNTDRSKLPTGSQLPIISKNLEYSSADTYIAPVVLADLTAYNAALGNVKASDYTPAIWTIYQAVVTANVVTAQNTQDEVNAATQAITAAQAALVAQAVVLDEYNTNLQTYITANGSNFLYGTLDTTKATITFNQFPTNVSGTGAFTTLSNLNVTGITLGDSTKISLADTAAAKTAVINYFATNGIKTGTLVTLEVTGTNGTVIPVQYTLVNAL